MGSRIQRVGPRGAIWEIIQISDTISSPSKNVIPPTCFFLKRKMENYFLRPFKNTELICPHGFPLLLLPPSNSSIHLPLVLPARNRKPGTLDGNWSDFPRHTANVLQLCLFWTHLVINPTWFKLWVSSNFSFILCLLKFCRSWILPLLISLGPGFLTSSPTTFLGAKNHLS